MNFLGNAAVAAFVALSVGAQSSWLPNPTLTPGAINPAITQANIHRTICVRGWTKTVRPPARYTDRLKRRQLAAEDLGNVNPRSMEEDHRVPLEVGGAPRDPKNLWPQRWQGQWGAHTKDRLENWAHRQICSGKMTLAQGRAIFLGNWIAAYKKYLLGG